MQNTRSQFPNQGSNPRPQQWEHGVLTTGPPRKSLAWFLRIQLQFPTSVSHGKVAQTMQLKELGETAQVAMIDQFSHQKKLFSKSILFWRLPFFLEVCYFLVATHLLIISFSTLFILKILKCKKKQLGEGNGNPLEYSCLENPIDRGAWQATVHGVARAGHDLVHYLTPEILPHIPQKPNIPQWPWPHCSNHSQVGIQAHVHRGHRQHTYGSVMSHILPFHVPRKTFSLRDFHLVYL